MYYGCTMESNTLGIIGKVLGIKRRKGFRFLIRKACVYSWRFIYSITLLRFRHKQFFTYGNEKYGYFCHPYNATWDNERGVEIPIIMKKLESFKGGKVLEVGNVLSHYYPVGWDVLDKFEKGVGVINQDAVSFSPSSRYDLIISISTLEHIGFDDGTDPYKIVRTLHNLKENCLKQGGRMVCTMPLGYNKFMDKLLFNDQLGFDEKKYLKRASKNEWIEVKKEELGNVAHGTTYIEASAIIVAEFKNSGDEESRTPVQ